MSQQIAIVMSEVFLRRLTPALMPFVRREHDFRIVSIHRPINKLLDLLRELNPRGLITEWLPEVTEAMLKLDLPTVIAGTDYSYPGVVSIDVWTTAQWVQPRPRLFYRQDFAVLLVWAMARPIRGNE